MADEVKENNKQLVCEIKIDTEMMRKIIDEKVAQIELDIQGIRAKAIDEFAEALKDICKNHPISNDGHTPLYIHEDGKYHELIEDAVKQMKGGAE